MRSGNQNNIFSGNRLIANQSHKSEEAADSVNDNKAPLITDDKPFIPALCMLNQTQNTTKVSYGGSGT
jgi:hypothetical protein